MSDYVPEQDPFAEFTHQDDWLRDVQDADVAWNEDGHEIRHAALLPGEPSYGYGTPSNVSVPQTFEADKASFNDSFSANQQPNLLKPVSLEGFELPPFDGDNFGALLDTLSCDPGISGHGSSSVPTQGNSSAMIDLASETQSVGLASHDTAIQPACPTDEPLHTGLVERTKARTTRKKDGYNTNLFCDFPGCPSKEAFRRPFELNRHMSKHNRGISYACPVDACNRRGSRAFYREDKLKAHLRSVHDDYEKSSCPAPNCTKGPLPLDLLRVHMHIHHYGEAPEASSLKSYAAKTRPCPLEKCRVGSSRWMRIDKIPGPNGHLSAHDRAERLDQRVSITSKGYDADSGSIICPICKQLCPGSPEFRKHLSDAHMTVTEHARLYGMAVRSSTDVDIPSGWCIWDELPFYVYKSGFKCPGCSVAIYKSVAVDHPGLIVTTEELYRHRREILRLLPDFYAHPVFDDVRRTS